MCGYHDPFFEIVFLGSAALVAGFDLVVGSKNIFQWTKRRGLQSFKALGIGAAALCVLAGAAYGGWGSLDSKVSAIFVSGIFLALSLYPLIDFALQKNKSVKQFIWRVPFMLAGLWIAFMATWSLVSMVDYWLSTQAPTTGQQSGHFQSGHFH